ncbi:MAG: T9SS C-terminal target domain-containing protein, partial [Calditrichaeota bacterium]
ETGVRIIKSKSVDALGNAAISDSGIVVQLRNFQPQITAISDTSVFEDSLFTMHVFASDANPLDSLFFTDNSNFFEVKTITSGHGLVEFTPTNETVGNHQITIYASDGQMIDSTRFNFAVINTNDAPLPFELLSPANGATTDSLNLSLSWVAAVDVDQGDSLYYQVMVSIREDFSDTLMISNTGTTLYRIPAGLQRSMQYFWQVTAIDQAGEKSICKSIFSFTTSGVATDVDGRISGLIPTEFALSQNYPNPFNPETRMEIQLPQNSHIRVMIFNMLGQRVTTLLDERKQAGYYELLWNGQNDAGQRMSSGIYIVSMQAEGFSFNRKMALVQ